MKKKKSKFTLIELLVVVTIISILMAMVYPAYMKHREKAAIVEARADMTKIITALSAYKTQYVDFELINDASVDYTVNWKDLKATLMGNDTDTNPRQIQFLTEDFDCPWNTGGTAYDGYDYRIKIDIDGDGIIKLTEGSAQTLKQIERIRDIIVYFKTDGLGLRTTGDDDVRSWD